jgi:xylulokinase
LGGHDHLCATFAGGAHTSGAVTDSSGSANALLMLMPRFMPDAALGERGYASYAYVLKDLYVLKGGLKAAGNAIDWVARQLSPGESGLRYAELEALAAEGVGRRAGPVWLPHWIGSGTPEGDRFSRAALVGVEFEHGRGDIFRGLLEGLAFWTRHNLEEMQAITQAGLDSLTLIGGVTRIRLLSQLKADVLNRPVVVPQIPEAAATGAALLAGLGAGVFSTPFEATSSPHYGHTQIDPINAHVAWYEALYNQVYRPLYAALAPVNHALEQLNNSGEAT